MSGVLLASNLGGTFLALLLCGHVLADFAFQSSALAKRKSGHWSGLALHTLLVLIVQGLLLAPYFSLLLLPILVGLALAHGAIDAVKVVLEGRSPDSLEALLLDQELHVLTLLGAWSAWLFLGGRGWLSSSPGWEEPVTRVAVLVALYVFNARGGAVIVSRLLKRFDLPRPETEEQTPPDDVARGWSIGIAERLLAVTLILVGQWSALGLIIAAKSIARFKDLEKRPFSEYYLIGTLSSVLIATTTALAARWLIG
jgi:hypothetical protein